MSGRIFFKVLHTGTASSSPVGEETLNASHYARERSSNGLSRVSANSPTHDSGGLHLVEADTVPCRSSREGRSIMVEGGTHIGSLFLNTLPSEQ